MFLLRWIGEFISNLIGLGWAIFLLLRYLLKSGWATFLGGAPEILPFIGVYPLGVNQLLPFFGSNYLGAKRFFRPPIFWGIMPNPFWVFRVSSLRTHGRIFSGFLQRGKFSVGREIWGGPPFKNLGERP